MDQALLKTLEGVGFGQKEASVYLALLELSHGSVSQISKLTNLKRPIIYVILEGLTQRGYATELPDKKINEYQALNPSIILQETKLSVKNFADMLPLFQTLHNKGEKRPKINYIETKEGIWKIYEEMIYAKEAFFISSYVRINEQFPDSIDNWVNNFKKTKAMLQGRHLVANDPKEIEISKKFLAINQKLKFLPEVKKISMDFAIYDNKLAITSLAENPFMVVIESQELVDSMNPIFEIAWASGKEI